MRRRFRRDLPEGSAAISEIGGRGRRMRWWAFCLVLARHPSPCPCFWRPQAAVPPSGREAHSPAPIPHPPMSIKTLGVRWQMAGLLFLVTFINYVDRVSLGSMAPLLKREI